jgi:hypothetical protein
VYLTFILDKKIRKGTNIFFIKVDTQKQLYKNSTSLWNTYTVFVYVK